MKTRTKTTELTTFAGAKRRLQNKFQAQSQTTKGENKTISSAIETSEQSPYAQILFGMINKARIDAETGDVSAILWLLNDAAIYLDLLYGGTGHARNKNGEYDYALSKVIFEFAKRQWLRIANGEIQANYGGEQLLAQFNEMMQTVTFTWQGPQQGGLL